MYFVMFLYPSSPAWSYPPPLSLVSSSFQLFSETTSLPFTTAPDGDNVFILSLKEST